MNDTLLLAAVAGLAGFGATYALVRKERRALSNPAGMRVHFEPHDNGTTTVSNSDESHTFPTKAVDNALWFDIRDSGDAYLDWAEWEALIDACYEEKAKLKKRGAKRGKGR